MNKKLIAVAIAAAMAAPAAFAGDTTLYGKVHMSISNIDTPAGDSFQVNQHSNRLGVKGSEDLGNGLKAVFKYEMSYNGADGQPAITAARNSYLGLAGDFGTFLVGRHDTPAKVAFYGAGNERLGDSIIDLNGAFGFSELRTGNAIAYISPNFSGITAAVALVPGETPAGADGLADGVSLGVMYKGGGLKAGLGYTDLEDLVGANTTLVNVGASYTMAAFSVGAQYQETEFLGNSRESWALTGTASFGNNSLILMYGNADDQAQGDADTVGLALKHKMSKRTSAYIAYRGADNNAIGTTPGANSGNWVGNGGNTAGGDAFGIGMIHSF